MRELVKVLMRLVNRKPVVFEAKVEETDGGLASYRITVTRVDTDED